MKPSVGITGVGKAATRLVTLKMDIMRGADFTNTVKISLPVAIVIATVLILLALAPIEAWAAPSADVAKRCFRYSYIAFPFKRPGSAPGSGDRQAYFKDCLARDGNVPQPARPAPKN